MTFCPSAATQVVVPQRAPLALAAPPEIRNGLLMVPASLLEAANVQVSQDAGTGQVTLKRRLENVTYTVLLTLDSPDYTWNGTPHQMPVPPYKAGSVIMVPLRVVAPVLGIGVTFDSATRTALLGWNE